MAIVEALMRIAGLDVNNRLVCVMPGSSLAVVIVLHPALVPRLDLLRFHHQLHLRLRAEQ
jgi:hypothetical protein